MFCRYVWVVKVLLQFKDLNSSFIFDIRQLETRMCYSESGFAFRRTCLKLIRSSY